MGLTTLAPHSDTRQASRRARLDARYTLHAESRLERVRKCGRTSLLPGGGVAVKVSGHGPERRAGLAGLTTCGSVWACPVCSHKVAANRADELAQAVRAWEAGGGRVALLTLTMRHKDGQKLAHLWSGLTKGWSRVTSGRGWVEDQNSYGIEGWCRAVEATHGRNGWHLHVHALVFVRPGADPRGFGERAFQRWRAGLVAAGLRAPIANRGGLDFRVLVDAQQEASQYLSKSTYDHALRAGWEVAGGGGKDGRWGNRSPFAILRDLVRLGDADDLDLWHEWEAASQGRKQLTWSAGLRRQLVDAPERSDLELAEDDSLAGAVELVLPVRAWEYICRHRFVARLLDVTEDGTVRAWLAGLRVPWQEPQDADPAIARFLGGR